MSKPLNEIKHPVKSELKTFEDIFRESMRSNVPLLNRITHFLTRHKGKQVRPLMVFLSAKVIGEIQPKTYRAASLVELLHTATLVHDDVVDDALERRGFFSVFALWKKKAAVLIGDYLLSKGLLLAVSNKDFSLLETVSDAVRKMSEGELLQIEKSRELNLTESEYFDIIERKTASLIASACKAGAESVSDNEAYIEAMYQYGHWIGISFQMKDDLFDYGNNKIGKPTGNDIQEKKITLPLLYTLQQIEAGQRRKILRILRKSKKKKSQVNFIIQQVLDHGGIQYTEKIMQDCIEKAKAALTVFDDNEAKQSLMQLADFVGSRKL